MKTASAPSPKIVWLASYPKSGNTWFRVFLANLVGERDDTVDLNEIGGGPIASSRAHFDRMTGVESSDLTGEEIERLRPKVYEASSAAIASGPMFCKIHDAFSRTPSGEPLVSASATRGAIYLIRNPLDVCVSYAHHSNVSIDVSVDALCAPGFRLFRATRSSLQLEQRLLSWSEHVRSWTTATEIPVHVVRYEDMKTQPLATFARAVRFAGLEYDDDAIARAFELSAFERLRERERAHGFREKAPRSESFFRKGEVGSWRDVLTPSQIERIVSCHRETMGDFGYDAAVGAA